LDGQEPFPDGHAEEPVCEEEFVVPLIGETHKDCESEKGVAYWF
jgi:hypothetical protein